MWCCRNTFDAGVRGLIGESPSLNEKDEGRNSGVPSVKGHHFLDLEGSCAASFKVRAALALPGIRGLAIMV